MKNIRLIFIFVLLFAGIGFTSCRGRGKADPPGNKPVQVVAIRAKSGDVIFYDSYPATVTAINEVQLHSEVSGFITGLFFKEGSRVNKGSALYEIDRTKYKAAYEAAKANAEIAATNLQKAERDADRYKKLDEGNAIAKQTLEDATTAMQNAQMQVKSATAALTSAETDFNYSLIAAPFTGTIGFSQVKPGDYITAGQTLLNTISSDDPIGVDFIADEKALPYLLRLQKNEKVQNDSTFRVLLPDNSGYKYTGKPDIIDRAVDPQTGTIRIRVVFPNNERDLRPGMNCEINVLNEYSGQQILIPSRALSEQMGEYFVYIIDTNNVVRQERIVPGPYTGSSVVVRSGLKKGDRIVLEGVQNMRDGLKVYAIDSGEKVNMTGTEQGQGKQKR